MSTSSLNDKDVIGKEIKEANGGQTIQDFFFSLIQEAKESGKTYIWRHNGAHISSDSTGDFTMEISPNTTMNDVWSALEVYLKKVNKEYADLVMLKFKLGAAQLDTSFVVPDIVNLRRRYKALLAAALV